MSLERKDIRAKLSPERHAQLRAICEVDGVDMGDFIEAVLLAYVAFLTLLTAIGAGWHL